MDFLLIIAVILVNAFLIRKATLQTPKQRAIAKHDDTSPFDAGVRARLRLGERDDAVRLYQDFTGVSAEDAQREIDRIKWEETERKRQKR